MAKTTCKKFTYAKYASGGAGGAISYTGGTMLADYLAKVDINEERTDEKEYADGHLIDQEKIPTGVAMTLELVNSNAAIYKDVLGYAEVGSSGSEELQLTEADPPFIGAGVLMANRHLGVITWEGYWIYKIQFTHNGVSAETRRDRTSWQHETINGNGVGVQLSSGGVICYYAHKKGMTESAAETWLKTHAGIQS
jgi:hypothetical protein